MGKLKNFIKTLAAKISYLKRLSARKLVIEAQKACQEHFLE